MQIDNQTSFKTIYPVILSPKIIQKNIAKRKKLSFFDFSLTLKTDIPNVLYIESFEFLIQTIVLKCDDEFLGYT